MRPSLAAFPTDRGGLIDTFFGDFVDVDFTSLARAPEPGTGLLTGLGLVGLALLRRPARRR